MSFPQRDKPIAKVCLLRPLPAGWTYPNGKEGHRSRCRRRREMGATDFCLRPNKRIFSALTQPAVIGVRQKRVDTTNHAERKIILPAQPRTVRGKEATISADNFRTKTAGIEKRLHARADRFRAWSLANYYQSLVDWAFLNGKAQEHRTTENVLGWSLRWTNRPVSINELSRAQIGTGAIARWQTSALRRISLYC